jgi:SP family sugar:H+ symporter-like MFS transporter
MSLECAIFIAGVIIQVTAFTSWVQIMVGRFISGLGVGGLSAAVPVVRPCAQSRPSPVLI